MKIDINDIRKCSNYPGGVDTIDLIIEKLEEIENRLKKLELNSKIIDFDMDH
jgi:hypothetical protein